MNAGSGSLWVAAKGALIGFFLLVQDVGYAQTLGEALNAPNLTWVTSGSTPWFAQTTVTHDGVAAAQTGSITNNQFTVLQTELTGPGTLTFWWQVPFQGPHRLLFVMNGATQAQIYGSGWRRQTNYLGSGNHILQWVFTNAPGQGFGNDAGQLDEVLFVPDTTAPFITSQPASLSQATGLSATFTVAAAGTPPLSYQWRFNGSNIAGAQSSSFTVTNTQASRAGSYSVVISNLVAATASSNATLSLVSVAVVNGLNDVPSVLTNTMAVAVGESHSLALQRDGGVVGWGNNAFGQAAPPADLTNAIAIAAGQFHSLALRADGTIAAWGRNDYGQTNVPANLTNLVAIACGGNFSLALSSDGTAAAWGDNLQGQSSVPPGLTNVTAISAGLAHSVALQSDGGVVMWGWNFSGIKNIPAGLTNATSIAAGFSHTLALKADGTVTAWGENFAGATNVPANLSNVLAIAGGTFRSLALKRDGTVAAWGSQTNVPTGLSNALFLAVGGYHDLTVVGDRPPVAQAALSSVKATTNGFSVSLPSQSGRVYRLEYKNSVSDSDWIPLPLVAGNGGVLVLTDSTDSNAQRFYRVRKW